MLRKEREQHITEGHTLHLHMNFALRIHQEEQRQAGNKTDHARKSPGNMALESVCSPLLKPGP